MISRKLLLLDRIATLVLAAALILGGALGIWWWTGTSPFPDHSNTHEIRRLVLMHWWPWASAVVGLALLVLGIRWLASHVSRTRVTDLRLRGSGSDGVLLVDAGTIADAAATAFADTLGVRHASGVITRDRGQLVAKITAVINPQADLARLAAHSDLVSAQLSQVTGRQDLRCRIELTVARTNRAQPRVH